MFARMCAEKKEQMNAAFSAGAWSEYTDYVHALKSSSLSIGGERLSQAAKESEAMGLRFLSEDASAEEKETSLAKLQGAHESLMALYDEFAETARALSEEGL